MQIFHELKRRNVLRVAAAYIVSAWLVIQVVETLFPLFGLSDAVIRSVVIVLAIGFLPALVFSWAFELTPDGLKLDKDVDLERSVTRQTGKKLDRIIVVILALALAYFAVDKFLLDPVRDAEQFESGRREGRIEALVTSFGDRSIAVLPFADMSPANDQGYFSDGISEELLNLLSTIPEVRVTSRSSAFSFKDQNISIPDIARRLQVSYILDGSVRKAGDQVRISAQLIDAETDTQLWSKNFDRTMQNIFQIQDEIASDVVEQIKGTLRISAPQQRETDAGAYALYLQARYQRRLGTAAGYEEAVRLYKEVLAIDPNYAPAWDEIATVYQNQSITGLRTADEGFELARSAALKAITIDPDYAPAYDSLGFMAQYHEPDLAEAARYYKRAIELAPKDPAIAGKVGMLLQTLGRVDTGLAPIEYAVGADPLSPPWQYTLGLAYLAAGRPEQAIQAFETTLSLSPEFSLAYYNLSVALMRAGRFDDAVRAAKKEQRESWRLIGLALSLYALERAKDDPTAAAQVVLDELIQKYAERSTYNIAYVYAWRDDPDNAFKWLNKAVELGDTGLGEILSERLFENLHDDARWIPFLRTLGKAPEQLASIELDATFSTP